MDLWQNGNTAKKYNTCLGCGNPILPGHICNPIAKARKTDPETSHEAARKVERKGKANAQRQKCEKQVRQYPGCTAAEYSESLGFLAHKRLPELRQAGIIANGTDRKCKVTGQMAMTWWPIDPASALPPFIDALGVVAD